MAEPILKTSLAGLDFVHPIAFAAGVDKNGEAVRELFNFKLAAVEVGTVTPYPQEGNPKPRVFRLPEDRATINRIGFPSDGAERVAERLAMLQQDSSACILGVNIGPGVKQINDPAPTLREMAKTFAPLAKYLVLNLSSPNTRGLQALQSEVHAREILTAMREGVGKNFLPVFLKISSDISDKDLLGVTNLAGENLCDGLIIGNTTTTRPDDLRGKYKDEKGGLSGRPLFASSTERLAMAWRMSGGKIPLIGVGGVDSAEAAWQKIIHGASLVQIYTAFAYQGPRLGRTILRGLQAKMREGGYESLEEAVGSAFKKNQPTKTGREIRSVSVSAPERDLRDSQEKAA